jgi:hypothetical protein
MIQEMIPASDTAPIPGPVDIIDGTRTAFAAGQYGIVTVLVLLGIARLLYFAAERYPTHRVVTALDLGSSKIRAFLTAFIGLLAASLVEIGARTGMAWEVLFGVVMATLALWFRPEPKGKPAELVTRKPSPPLNVPPA